MKDSPKKASIDTRGLLCPLPIVKTAEGIRRLSVGDCLEVLADDPGIQVDLPEWCDETGHELLEVRKEGAIFRCLVRKAC